jgi:hypothetical protein
MMPELDASDVTRIARDAAREESLPLEVVGAVLGGSGSDYVEILVNIDGCTSEPCRFEIGVFRGVPEVTLRHEIAARFHQYLEERRTFRGGR